MDENHNQSVRENSYSIPSEIQIDQVAETVQKIDREIEKFYQIHGIQVKNHGGRSSRFGVPPDELCP